MVYIIDPQTVSQSLRQEIRQSLLQAGIELKIAGLICPGAGRPAEVYAQYAEKACLEVGIKFQTHRVPPQDMKRAILAMNEDDSVHGIFVFYPVYGDAGEHVIPSEMGTDADLRAAVTPLKDIEGMSSFWLRKLYANERFLQPGTPYKAILPCTPLAIMKLLSATSLYQIGDSLPLAGLKASVFNRSEVVGRPLAHMLANDGAEVYSFDEAGCQKVLTGSVEEVSTTRAEALAQSDIIITGVPNVKFPLIEGHEIIESAHCINFSSIKNFAESAKQKCAVYVPRVGPMTVTMVMRNTLRLGSFQLNDAAIT